MKKEVLVLDDATGNELVLPRTDMIQKAILFERRYDPSHHKKVKCANNMPHYHLQNGQFILEKLFEQEVPEIEDGLITIKRIVRLPGERAKLLLNLYDDRMRSGRCM